MIRKLLITLTVVIGTIGVGWAALAGTTTSVGTLEELKTAIANASLTEITLTADITNADATEGSAITIGRSLTLNGKGHTISGNAMQNVIVITANDVTVKNISVTNTKPKESATVEGGNGICVFKATGAVLNNIQVNNNSGAGVVINGSTVSIDGIYAIDNLWGGINLDTTEVGMSAPKLTIKKIENVTGPLQIYADKAEANANWVEIQDTTVWESIVAADKRVWTNKVKTVNNLKFYINPISIKEINALITYSAALGIKGVQFSITSLTGQKGSPILINKDGFILDGNGSFLTGRIKDCMIHVTANNVTLRNVRGTNFDGNMVFVENAIGTQIESCEFTESAGAGLLIKNSSVTAKNLKTNINKKGGVIVSGLTAERKFTMTSGTLFEKEAVWTEDSKDFIKLPAEYVATTTGKKTVWTNGSSPIVYFTPEGAGNQTGVSLDNAYAMSSFKTILSSSPENCIMKLGAGTYDYTHLSPIEIGKTVTIEGADSTTCIIKGNFEIKGTSTQAVTFKKVKINSTATAIDITNPQLTLTLDAVSIDGTYGVQFNSYTADAAPTYIVKNSHIHASTYYALRTRSKGTYNWTIENSKIEGWCALYMSLGTPIITVTNSHLYGTNKQPGGTDPIYTNGAAGNGFATIVFESTQNGNITLNNTDVKSFWTEDSKCRLVQNSIIFQVNENVANTQKLGVKNNTVALKNASSLYIDRPEYAPIFIYHGASSATYGKEENNWVTTDGTATYSYGKDNKKPLVISAQDKKIRTVIAPIQEGIDNLNYWTADNDIITVPVGTIELTKPWEIQKAITLQGSDSATCIIKGQIDIARNVETTLMPIVLKNLQVEAATGINGLINVMSNQVSLQLDAVRLHQLSTGTVDSWEKTAKGIAIMGKKYNPGANPTDVAITLTNTSICLEGTYHRGVSYAGQIQKATNNSITLNKSSIIAVADPSNATYGRGISVYGLKEPVIKINDSQIKGFYYSVSMSNNEKPNITIVGSEITGYAAINSHDANSTYTITKSTLTGRNFYSDGQNNFATIVLGNNSNMFNIAESTITNVMTGNNSESLTLMHGTGNTFNFTTGTILKTTNNQAGALFLGLAGNTYTADGTVKFLDENNKTPIMISSKTGELRNAVTTIPMIIFRAYESGDVAVCKDTTVLKALKSLKESTITSYNITDSVIIKCSDGTLVTGSEIMAKAYAAANEKETVLWLKYASGDNGFTIHTVSTDRVVSSAEVWNDLQFANRKVRISKTGSLTINVPMQLDSLFMDEGAELITALPVTAKTLQAKYTVAANKWKPFAFPVSGMTVKDAKDDKTVTPIAKDATTGVWFAELSTNNVPAFEHKNAFAQAGIIAANAATEILVASPAASDSVSLITKPEPTAPTDATVQFLFVANPNLFAMALTQTAYVLNEAGTAFERRDGAVIQPFQSYVLADAGTTATLRSLRVDGVVTENEVIPTDGYYVESTRGAIVIHTAEPVEVVVVDMTGKMVYHSRATMDGCVIALPAGIYAVNRQMVIVK